MRIRHLLLSAVMIAAGAVGLGAQQPYSACWQPDQIRNWSPETDPVAKFNRSRVPLAKRFKEPELMKANANQFYEGQVCNATILYDMCSLCPAQGCYDFVGYQPTYWQYMDKLVHWAGSASEGIIIPPPAPSIDAAHQAGVKVLGQLFFPPTSYGGNIGMIQAMTMQENGKYVMAEKMYEIAKYLGFDGWFINEELGSAESTWVAWINAFYAAAHADGDYNMEIQFYNARNTPIIDILKTDKNTSQFIEYGNAKDYRGYASQLGCTEAETFHKIYAGVQCVSDGLTGWNGALNGAFPTTGHVGSLDLFCPEEHSWKDNVRSLIRTSEACGEKAYSAVKKTFENENDAWVNVAGDPSDISAVSTWRGVSGAVLERSVISSMPFVSNMCVGVGKYRFVDGKKVGTQDWNHSGVQSILPTWRWWIENRGTAKVEIDWEDAYNHGSSFKISGLSSGKHLVRLYKTMIPVSNSGVARVAFKGATPELKLSTASSVNPDVTLQATSTTDKNGWTVAEYDLSSLNGKTLYMIALNVSGDFSLGQVALLPAGYKPAPIEITNLKVESTQGETESNVRLTWDWEWSDDFDRFDIYAKYPSGTRTLVGQTRGEAFYVPALKRERVENAVTMEVVPVMKDQVEQTPATAEAKFATASAPEVSFYFNEGSKSYLKVGEEATVTAIGTYYPTGYKWTLPESLELVSGELTDATITVRAKAEGRQKVVVEATNEIGTSADEVDLLDVYSESDYNAVPNVAQKKGVDATNIRTGTVGTLTDGDIYNSYVEYPCQLKSATTINLDLGGNYRLYGLEIHDAKSHSSFFYTPRESNYLSHTIQISVDGKTWRTIETKDNLRDKNIKTCYIGPRRVRYIRLNIESDDNMAIWEIVAKGVEDKTVALVEINAEPKALELAAGEESEITVSYDFKGTPREDNFSLTAKADNKSVVIGEITEDKDNSRFTVPVAATSLMGVSQVTLTAVNGQSKAEVKVPVTVDSESQPNVLAGMNATIRSYNVDYSLTAEYTTYTTGALTDGDTTKEALEMIETPSTHKDDAWAIFEAPESWNLSKIKIYLPGENYGTNDNDNEGVVTNSISIAVGNDIDNLAVIKTFESLDRVSELTYILPAYKSVKYVAVVCNLNPYFFPSLAEVEAFEQNPDAIPVNGPVEIANWEHDVLAEAKPVKDHVNYALDDANFVLFTSSLSEDGCIAGEDRTIVTSNGTEFCLAPYDGNNAMVIKSRNAEKTLEFVTPLLCDKIQLLTISANGNSTLLVRANYNDGTTSEEATFKPSDWFGGSTGTAVYGLKRVDTSDNIDGRAQFRLYEHEMTTDGTKAVKSLTLKSTGDGYPTVFGVSRIGRRASSAVENVAVENAAREIEAIYNLHGIRVANAAAPGIYIVRYTDGTTAKIAVK